MRSVRGQQDERGRDPRRAYRPALKAAGWGVVEGSRVLREHAITQGRDRTTTCRSIATPSWRWSRPNQPNRAFDVLKRKFFCSGGRAHVGAGYQDWASRSTRPQTAESPGEPTEAIRRPGTPSPLMGSAGRSCRRGKHRNARLWMLQPMGHARRPAVCHRDRDTR